MTGDPVTTASSRRRAVLRTALRSSVIVCAVITLYYLAPLDRPLTTGTALLLGGALLLFAVFIWVQVRDILASEHPRLRAVQALIVGLPLLIVMFAASYCTVDAQQPAAFSEALTRTDGIYFAVTVFATVGFGDITPVSQLARVLVTVQMVLGLLTVGVIAKILVGAVQVAESRRTERTTGSPVPPQS